MPHLSRRRSRKNSTVQTACPAHLNKISVVRAACEPLEPRRLLCATGTPGFYQGSEPAFFNGTEGPDDIYISVTGGCGADDRWVFRVNYYLNNDLAGSFLTEDYGVINLNTLGGNDTVLVRGLREHSLSVDLGTGNDSLTVDYDHSDTSFDGPPYGIWEGARLTVLGNVGYDTVNYNAIRLGASASFVRGYIIDSNAWSIAGTRVATGYQRPGESFFASQNQMQYNGVENVALTASTFTTAPTIVNIDSLVSTSATINTPGNGPTTVSVAPFVGGEVITTGGPGTDVFNIGKQTNSAVTHVNGGGGSNTLNLIGTNGPDAFSVLSNGLIAGHTVASYTNIQALALDGGAGNDSFSLNGALAVPYSVKGGLDNDTITVTPNVLSLPPIDGGAGINTLVLDHDNIAGSVAYTFASNGVQFNGALNGFIPTSNLSNVKFRLDAAPGNDTFLLAPSFPYSVEVRGNAGNDRFSGAGAAAATLYGGDGNDEFVLGNGNLLAGASLVAAFGEAGNDIITYDDHLSAGDLPWTINGQINGSSAQNRVFLGINEYSYAGFEQVRILGGTAAQEFRLNGTLGVALDIDAGPNADDFILGHQGSVYFNNAVTLTGGTGPDLFTVNDAAVSAFTAPLVMNGGVVTEFNGLVVNEPLATGYEIGPSYFIPKVGASNQGVFTFANMTAHIITGNAGHNDFTIYSAGASAGTFQIDGGSGDDTFHLVPQPSGYTFKGLTINGQPGVDTVYLDGTALSTNESYTVGSNLLQIARPAGTETITVTSMNSIALSAGSGNDSITMNQYSAGIPVTVNGGFGDDTLNIGGGNLSANITSIAAFTFNGQSGFDRFNLNNASEPGAWQYIRDIGIIRSDRLTAPIGYFVILGETGIEEMTVNAGPAGDAFYTRAIEPGASCILNAGGGLDGLVVADSTQNLQGIQGLVRYNAGAGGGNMLVSDNADTTGDTGHLTDTTLGAFPGDNLFGPGGRLEFSNIVNFGASPGITLNCSSSADTIYATPLASARVTINGGNPPAATGDILNLALGAAVGYAINGTIATGNVTSSNLQTLNWTGFETGPNIDAVAPAVVAADINLNGAPGFAEVGNRQALDVQFSENVSSLLSSASLQLTNQTTGQIVPTSNIAVQYITATNTARFTFPGYFNGILPDGNYQGKILAGLPDFFGNALRADANFSFFFLNGDANHDRLVDIGDFAILASNFNSGSTFAQGDFDYSGLTDIGDFAILASKFNTSLPARRAMAPAGSPFAGQRTLATQIGDVISAEDGPITEEISSR